MFIKSPFGKGGKCLSSPPLVKGDLGGFKKPPKSPLAHLFKRGEMFIKPPFSIGGKCLSSSPLVKGDLGGFKKSLHFAASQQRSGLGCPNSFFLVMLAHSGLVDFIGQIIKISGFEKKIKSSQFHPLNG